MNKFVGLLIFLVLWSGHSLAEETMTWDGKDRAGYNVPSGMYFYKVISDNRILSGKMLLLK